MDDWCVSLEKPRHPSTDVIPAGHAGQRQCAAASQAASHTFSCIDTCPETLHRPSHYLFIPLRTEHQQQCPKVLNPPPTTATRSSSATPPLAMRVQVPSRTRSSDLVRYVFPTPSGLVFDVERYTVTRPQESKRYSSTWKGVLLQWKTCRPNLCLLIIAVSGQQEPKKEDQPGSKESGGGEVTDDAIAVSQALLPFPVNANPSFLSFDAKGSELIME